MSVTAAPVLRPLQAPSQPRTDLERVLPADVVGGLHGRHAEAEEGDAAQDALLLLVWWANAGGYMHGGAGNPACPPKKTHSCCGDTVPSLRPAGGQAGRQAGSPPVGNRCLPVAASWRALQPAQLFMPALAALPALSPASCRGGEAPALTPRVAGMAKHPCTGVLCMATAPRWAVTSRPLCPRWQNPLRAW